MRDKNALRRPWLVEGIMDEAVKEEEHDQRPSSEEPQRVFPSHQVQQQYQNPHNQPLMQQRTEPNAAAE